MEYCRYILGKDKNPYVKSFDEEIKEKEEFYQSVDEIVEMYKSSYKIKDKDFSYDKLIIQTMEFFLHSKVVFMKCERDKFVDSIYKKIKEALKEEQENLKKKKQISNEKMFEIITYFSILCCNTLENLDKNENEKIVIQYKTMNIDTNEIMCMIEETMGILERSAKVEKKPKWKAAGIMAVVKPLMKSRFAVLMGTVLAGGIASKSLWDMAYKNKTDKELSLYMYLGCLISATYTRNEELKERVGYGW